MSAVRPTKFSISTPIFRPVARNPLAVSFRSPWISVSSFVNRESISVRRSASRESISVRSSPMPSTFLSRSTSRESTRLWHRGSLVVLLDRPAVLRRFEAASSIPQPSRSVDPLAIQAIVVCCPHSFSLVPFLGYYPGQRKVLSCLYAVIRTWSIRTSSYPGADDFWIRVSTQADAARFTVCARTWRQQPSLSCSTLLDCQRDFKISNRNQGGSSLAPEN